MRPDGRAARVPAECSKTTGFSRLGRHTQGPAAVPVHVTGSWRRALSPWPFLRNCGRRTPCQSEAARKPRSSHSPGHTEYISDPTAPHNRTVRNNARLFEPALPGMQQTAHRRHRFNCLRADTVLNDFPDHRVRAPRASRLRASERSVSYR